MSETVPIKAENRGRQNRHLSQLARQARVARATVKDCELCGKVFHPYHPRKSRHCSVKCRKRATAIAAKKAKQCAQCGNSFLPLKSAKAAYCSATCKRKRYRILAENNPARMDRKKQSERNRWKSDAYRFSQANFKAKRRAAERCGGIKREEWQAIVQKFGNRCAYCRKAGEKFTMDHVIPLSRGGPHTIQNVVPACRSCNSAKRDRDWSHRLLCP